jgi:hypothetical protein
MSMDEQPTIEIETDEDSIEISGSKKAGRGRKKATKRKAPARRKAAKKGGRKTARKKGGRKTTAGRKGKGRGRKAASSDK